MNKLINVNTLVIALLLVVLVALLYINNQVTAQNQVLHNQVSKLKTQVFEVKNGSDKIQGRLEKIEQQLQVGVHPLLAGKSR